MVDTGESEEDVRELVQTQVTRMVKSTFDVEKSAAIFDTSAVSASDVSSSSHTNPLFHLPQRYTALFCVLVASSFAVRKRRGGLSAISW
jgi:hypothetical protein